MNFILIWGHVRKNNGVLWLRFDDVDQARCDDTFIDGTKNLLNYLGMDWDNEYSQQKNKLPEYKRVMSQLPHYVCSCSRQEIEKRTGGKSYDGHCRDRNLTYTAGENAIRFLSSSSPQADFVLWRREDLPAYHLTCLCDDEAMGITTVIRGKDLEESTRVQKELSNSLSQNPLATIDYFHHRLLLNNAGEKLSKTRQDGELISLMKKKVEKKIILGTLATKMNLSHELHETEDFLKLNIQDFLV